MDNAKTKSICALYYPETICLDETELKYFLLVYDKLFFLPIDNLLNPGHTTLTKRWSLHDLTLASAFRNKRDVYPALMYTSEPPVWNDALKRLMALYDELESKGVVVGLRDASFEDPNKWHPLKESVDADMKDSAFLSACHRHENKNLFMPIMDSVMKGGGMITRPALYKGGYAIPSICSERMNATLFIAGRDNLFPVCGHPLYVELLSAKLQRASQSPEAYATPPSSSHRFSLLSWEIATEVVPTTTIASTSLPQLMHYKEACIDLKEKFRNHLWNLEASFSSEPWHATFRRELQHIVSKDIMPEVHRIREQKLIIWEKLFGDTIRGLALKTLPALVAIHLAPGLSYWDILLLSTSAVGATALKPLIDACLEERKRRRNALFFLMRLNRR